MAVRSWRDRWAAWWWVVPVLAVAFPMLRMWPLNAQFAIDWNNHKWLAAYPGQYLRVHHSLPAVIDTAQDAGMPYPIFYGALFYPLLALFTAWLEPGWVIRIAVIIVTWLQYRLVAAALLRYVVSRWASRGVACLVIWAIYPLTNLYSRSAITEYVATGLLTCTIATWFLLLRAETASERRTLGLGLGLLFSLAVGTHPITALYSLPILVLLLIAAAAEHGVARTFWGPLLRALVLPIGMAVLVIGPWLYGLVQFQPLLRVSMHNATDGMWFYAGIDEWATRFMPFPYDPRVREGVTAETPYLDAQINMALAALLVGWLVVVAWRDRRLALSSLRVIAICLVTFAVFTWLSLMPSAFTHLPKIASIMQFGYRAITYQNAALLLALFMLVGYLRRRGASASALFAGRPVAAAVMAGCLALSAVGVVIKFEHADLTARRGPIGPRTWKSERDGWTKQPGKFYGYFDYATPPLYTSVTPDEAAREQRAWLPIGTGRRFGLPEPLHIAPAVDTLALLDVQAFPWNHLYMDGAEIPPEALRVDDIWYVVEVPAGPHVIELRTTPDPVWQALRLVSFAAYALGLAAFGWLRWRRPRAATSG